MKTLVFDCSVGVQATRIWGALLDLGAREEILRRAVERLPWAQAFEIRILRMPSAGLPATCVTLGAKAQEDLPPLSYGYEHDHDMDLPGHYAEGSSVWGQMHEQGQLMDDLLPIWQRGFAPGEALSALDSLELAAGQREVLARMIESLASMRQAQPAGNVKYHELLLLVGTLLLIRDLDVERIVRTPVCVAGDALSRVLLGVLAPEVTPIPLLRPEGLRVGYGHEGRETSVPDVLRACLGEAAEANP